MQCKILFLLSFLSASILFAAPKPNDPFYPDVTWANDIVTITFMMPDSHQHIYDDMLMCSLGAPLTKPESSVDSDGRVIYEGFAEFTWAAPANTCLTLDYQGCDAAQCYMPQSLIFSIMPDGSIQEGNAFSQKNEPSTTPTDVVKTTDSNAIIPSIHDGVTTFVGTPSSNMEGKHDTAHEGSSVNEDLISRSRKRAGFIDTPEFIAFLKGDSTATPDTKSISLFDNPRSWVAAHGFWLLVGLVFVFGIALNLTPCVLPMMPINLAIIGAGAAGGSRLKGALRGGAYGLGIALAYGILSLIPVLTGTAFGTLQSTWWFNAAIATIFILLALALFDLFVIDFTKFAGTSSGKQGTVAAFVAGAISAILAGACVAPILIAVLLLTTDYVAEGAYWALCLPFVLGIGMAAPWPIAGAGLAFLPKPGAWMVWVKKVFAVIVLLFAAYYIATAIKILRPSEGLDGRDFSVIISTINNAKTTGKPILLDFWGPACKACDQMETTTLKDADVVAILNEFEVLKIRMDLSDRAIQTTQEFFGIQGLPTFIVIE